MKIAIMQPYIFPYIGYYSLVKSVDHFVFFDDVNYISKGWINRNKIRVNQKEYLFTVPINKASQNTIIKDVEISHTEYTKWYKKFYKTLKHNYNKDPYFKSLEDVVVSVFEEDNTYMRDVCIKSVETLSNQMGFGTKFSKSSDFHIEGKGQEKIVNICKHLGATTYVNAIGGTSLYDTEYFKSNNISLKFLESKNPHEYLSVLDLLPKMGLEVLSKECDQYSIISKEEK